MSDGIFSQASRAVGATGRTIAPFALVSALAVSACGDSIEPPPPVVQADYEAAFAKHKQTRATFVATPGKAISYTGLRWLPQGTSTVGGDTSNNVIIKGRDVPAKIGTLTRDGDNIRFEPVAGLPILLDSAPATAQQLVVEGSGKPASRVTVGTAGFRIIKRVDSIGVRSWDNDLAASNGLAPLEYFPLDQAWRFGGKFIRHAKPDTQAVPTVSGVAEEYINVGTVQTKIGDKLYDLTAYAGSNPTDLFFTFDDATSGEETYGFRFVHAPLDTVKNTVVMDFNFSYNPECAFSAFTTCPLPSANNRISTRITAGELTPKKTGEKK